jgi:hypothetical protein
VTKQSILEEIKRTAIANGGKPLGVARFFQETGIKDADWRGKIWVRWSDALREAGFEPNQLQSAYGDDVLIEKFISFIRELGRFPVATEIRMKARKDGNFPWHNTFARFGSKHQFASRILAFCKERIGNEDVIPLCTRVIAQSAARRFDLPAQDDTSGVNQTETTKEGYVYLALLKLGREKVYKIGNAVLVERRTDQISLQLPEELELVHVIRTDDAYGIENYWHRRFAEKNRKGEWFSLSRQDIQAFKRRKFM